MSVWPHPGVYPALVVPKAGCHVNISVLMETTDRKWNHLNLNSKCFDWDLSAQENMEILWYSNNCYDQGIVMCNYCYHPGKGANTILHQAHFWNVISEPELFQVSGQKVKELQQGSQSTTKRTIVKQGWVSHPVIFTVSHAIKADAEYTVASCKLKPRAIPFICPPLLS